MRKSFWLLIFGIALLFVVIYYAIYWERFIEGFKIGWS